MDQNKNKKFNLTLNEKEEIANLSNPKEKLIKLFKIIKNKSWIHFERKQENADGLLGNVFEDLIGIEENNKSEADYFDYEIKTKNLTSDALVSLFGCTIKSFLNANTEIRQKYGVPDEKHPENKIFNTTVKYSKWNTHRGGHNFKLEKTDNLYLRIKKQDQQMTIDDNRYYRDENEIIQKFIKIKNCCLIEGEIDKKNKLARYTKMIVFRNADIDKFWALLKSDDIVIDFRIGVHLSGKRKGKTHDHGTGFRIKKNKFTSLYRDVEEVE